MSKPRRQHAKCSVVGCQKEHQNLFTIPISANAAVRDQWLNFIYNNSIPAVLPSTMYVCGNHFSLDCFANIGQYRARKASNLRLEKGVIPTIRQPTAAQSVSFAALCDMLCGGPDIAVEMLMLA